MPLRRSRIHRTPTGKQLALTARDIELFKTLVRYRYLRSTYLHAFVGGASETRFKERLGDLFHEGYLDRPEAQWKLAASRYLPAVHELGAGGQRVLANHNIEMGDARTWLRGSAHRQFEHSVMICELLASIEIGMREQPGLRFIPWPEIAAKAPATNLCRLPRLSAPISAGLAAGLVPDALFGIEYAASDRKRYRFFAFEADRGTMPVFRTDASRTSIIGKVAAYRAYVTAGRHRTELGVPNLLVLIATSSAARLESINAAIEAEYGAGPGFLLRTATCLSRPAPALLTEPWERAGCAALSIADPN